MFSLGAQKTLGSLWSSPDIWLLSSCMACWGQTPGLPEKPEVWHHPGRLASLSHFGIMGVSVCWQCQSQELKGSQRFLPHLN